MADSQENLAQYLAEVSSEAGSTLESNERRVTLQLMSWADADYDGELDPGEYVPGGVLVLQYDWRLAGWAADNYLLDQLRTIVAADQVVITIRAATEEERNLSRLDRLLRDNPPVEQPDGNG